MRKSYLSLCKSIFSAAAILFLLFIPIAAQTDEVFVPTYHPTLEISKTTESIKIDGELNDIGWQNVVKVGGFAEHTPGDQTKPPVDTKAMITYDDKNLYVAMICYDDPNLVRASFCERERVGSDDNICLLIDTYGDASWAYELNVNPYGIQADAIWSNNVGEDDGYDLIWESAGKITKFGYQIEMAIPFSSLRFPNKEEQIWKVDFWRNHPREVRGQYSWAAYDRDVSCWPCQWGTITGIKNVQPGKGIEILPTVIGYQSGMLNGEGSPDSPYKFENEKVDGALSLGGKYAVTSDIIVEATYNPDFSQIEADAAQVDVNTNFALSFSERRPFFQEGSDLFSTIFNAVYTRSINNPEFAGKVTARMGSTSLAYLSAVDEDTPLILPFEESSKFILAGKSVSNIVRARQTIGDNSRIGFLMTNRNLNDGGSGTLLGADGSLQLTKGLKFEFQGLATRTVEANNENLNQQFKWLDSLTTDSVILNDPAINDTLKYDTVMFADDKHTSRLDGEKYWGNAFFGMLSQETGNLYTDISFLLKSPTYRADNGFQPSNNQKSIRSISQYHFRFKEGLLERLTPNIYCGYQWNFAGETKNKFIELSLEGKLRTAQTGVHALYRREMERYHGIDYDNIWLLHNCFNTRPSEMILIYGSINYRHNIARGYDSMGREITFSIGSDIKPFDRLLFENNINYVKSNELESNEELYKGYILWTRLSLQITRELSFRMVNEYDDFNRQWNFDPLITFRLNPFSIFYVGSTIDRMEYSNYDENDEIINTSTKLGSRQFFVKLQYLFQI
ncbi:MAG: DUF5916 domain-containing protein [bacterium]